MKLNIPSRKSFQHPAQIEPMEARRMMSTTLVGGNLKIVTGPAADNINIDYVAEFDASTGSDFNAYVTGTGSGDGVYSAYDINSIELHTGAGNDNVTISFCGASPTVWADLGDGNDTLSLNDSTGASATVFGGNGNDTIYTLPGNDYIDPGRGTNTVDGGGGTDTILGSSGPDTAISGNVFNDANQNWIKDASESGLAGTKVFLDTNNNGKLDSGEVWTTTDNAGNYAFDSLSAGIKHVREVMPAGYRNVLGTTSHYDVNVYTGTTFSNANFDLTANALVSVHVFKDTNGNGKQDGSETGLAGARVYIDLNHDGHWQSNENSKITDASGNVNFTGLKLGTYQVRIVPPAGYHQTAPSSFFTITIKAGDIASLSFGAKHN